MVIDGSFRCPLCLKVLTEAIMLSRVCMTHDAPAHNNGAWNIHQFHFDPARIRCPKSISCNEVIGMDGVFLRHDQCPAKMPEVPGAVPTSSQAHVTIDGRPAILDHYEISMVAGTSGPLPMWFPPMLLRATREEVDGHRIGSLVAITGDQGVGKTVLALQAMDREGYGLQDGQNVITAEFIYCRPQTSAQPNNRWYELLDFRGKMRSNSTIGFNPSGTQPVPGDLMAVFFKPRGSQMRTDSHRGHGGSRPQTRGERIAASWMRFRLDIARRFALVREQWRVGRGARIGWWYTLAFYDTAGELAGQQYASLLSNLDEAVDKALIVVSGEEIPSGVHPSMRVAINRLNHLLPRRNVSRALVITKADLLIAGSSMPAQLIERLNAAMADSALGRDLLRDILKASPRSHESDELLSRLGEFDAIFFISTPAFESGNAASIGLLSLVSWCLDVDSSEIVWQS